MRIRGLSSVQYVGVQMLEGRARVIQHHSGRQKKQSPQWQDAHILYNEADSQILGQRDRFFRKDQTLREP